MVVNWLNSSTRRPSSSMVGSNSSNRSSLADPALAAFAVPSFSKPRVAARLAQLQHGVQHDDAGLRQAALGDGVPHLGVHRQPHALIDRTLRCSHLHRFGDVGLGRQVRRDLRFGPAQQERRDPAGQLRLHRLVAPLLDGRAVAAGERLAGAEEAWHQEVEQGPQLAQVVL